MPDDILNRFVMAKLVKLAAVALHDSVSEELATHLAGKLKEKAAVAAGGVAVCVCSACKARIPHVKGQPCSQRKCPQCGKSMADAPLPQKERGL